MDKSLRALEVLKETYNIDQLTSGNEYIKELIRRIARVLNVKFVMVGHAVEPGRSSIQTDFLWSGDSFVDNVVYSLEDTPCSEVLCGTRVNCYASRTQHEFPKDTMLADLNVESYIGAPFLHTDGGLLGLLVIMDDKPMLEQDLFTSVVEFFAARIGTEYRRMAAEDSLKKINERLEQLVQQRTKELQTAFESLQKTQKQLISQEKLATIGRITFGIAHELKNPLNIILNASEILQEPDLDSDSTQKAVEMIRQHSQRANNIITNMLRQARQDNQTEPEKVLLSEMLNHTLDIYVRSLTNLELKSRLHLRKEIESERFVKIIDPPSLERVLINIIDNAMYALNENLKEKGNGYTPLLSVQLKTNTDHVHITIEDNGTGIPQKHIPNIYDEFYTTKPAGEGTGLGLWFTKQTLQKNGGDISIESREGEFTKVQIELPRSEV